VFYKRRRILDREQNLRLLGDVMRKVREDAPFQTVAMVVLPDHLHCIWSLPGEYPPDWGRSTPDSIDKVASTAGE
jgi:REP element-mobilizing transposase RayT